ncbi:hypothetical protein [Roseibium salinum]|uniref:Uncharacterized protein n=1 Tax=Roseibium salinum TaxID=1604349 RepID=A0ABT3R8J0_9HYPH|nr:hypothetical protein [Roseibium sp. DSM 29163]MCX2725381.1 hypothetical protein [Roseibium sp. DSM 29163]MDN3720789.1 hypothetical protein [Roseibium salinum]
MTPLLVILGSLVAVGCLVGLVFYWADLKEEQQRAPSDQDWEPDVGTSEIETDIQQRSEIPGKND